MKKLKIAVLFGGCSPEYPISLQSAYSVITHFNCEKYEPVLLGITKSGNWFRFSGASEKIYNDTWNNSNDCVRAIISPDRETRGVLVFDSDKVSSIRLDAALPVLHGKNGEDGTVQGLLELAGIPVAGCKALASALGMDKSKAHKIASTAGVRVPRSFTVRSAADRQFYYKQAENIGYPLFVKPVKSGSSFGISKVVCETALSAAVKLAFEYDDEVIVEETIPGFEVGCAVLGNENPTVGAVYEVELADARTESYFDFNEKYYRATARIHVPARIPQKKADEIRDKAKIIYNALGCSGFARIDMFLTPDGDIVFNEINTIPGFTDVSVYMSTLKACGMAYGQVIEKIIDLAVEK